MTRRLLLAAGLVVLLGALAGCSSILGPSEPNPEELNASADYDWNTNATTSVNVSRSSYTSVITIRNNSSANRTDLVVYSRDDLGTKQPVKLSALRFRYPNGTVVNASAIGVENEQKRTIITVPAPRGKVAFTAPRNGKRFSSPVFVTGSYAVTLPKGARVGIPLLSQVSPRATEKTVTDDRMTIYWEEVERGPIVARYYLQRDILLFGSMLGILIVVGAGGAVYYLRQIKSLERQREEVGLDVETDDDEFDDGPPPGMQ